VTISGQEFLPRTGVSRPLIPELIELRQLLGSLGITREQLVDLAILVGTDFNAGVKGIGPKTSLKLVKKYGRLEALPEECQRQLPDEVGEIRKIFLQPTVTDDYETKFKGLNEAGLRTFLCDERAFSQDRVDLAIKRTKVFYAHQNSTLTGWLHKSGT
jgi:flap endonuclease-1